MFVCICKSVSHREIEDAVDRGDVSSVACLKARLGVGTGCGTCLEFARECLTDALSRDIPTASAANFDPAGGQTAAVA